MCANEGPSTLRRDRSIFGRSLAPAANVLVRQLLVRLVMRFVHQAGRTASPYGTKAPCTGTDGDERSVHNRLYCDERHRTCVCFLRDGG
jgi:hypothetical protein